MNRISALLNTKSAFAIIVVAFVTTAALLMGAVNWLIIVGLAALVAYIVRRIVRKLRK